MRVGGGGGVLFWRAVQSLGGGVPQEEVSYCWVGLEVDSLAQLSVHLAHVPASQCCPSMMDRVSSDCEPKYKVTLLLMLPFVRYLVQQKEK